MNTVLYHANCYDGFGAAWVARQALGDADTRFIPMQYGGSIPRTLSGRIYMLDWSAPRDVILGLKNSLEVIILDHHKTAQANLKGINDCVFDMEKSGAQLAWEYWFPNPSPLFIAYLADRDLWRFKLPHSREIAAWLRSYPMDFEVWDKLIDSFCADFDQIVNEGLSILRFQSQQVNAMCAHAVIRILGGHSVPVANATVFFSEVGERLCELYPDAPFAGYYLDRSDGQRQWGLRSRSGFDVSEIAKQYGGGGHKAAAGFQTEQMWHGDNG